MAFTLAIRQVDDAAATQWAAAAVVLALFACQHLVGIDLSVVVRHIVQGASPVLERRISHAN